MGRAACTVEDTRVGSMGDSYHTDGIAVGGQDDFEGVFDLTLGIRSTQQS